MGQRRDSQGRFVRQRTATSRSQAGVGQLALLTSAIVLGLLGFLVSVCWVGALVLMGVLWGSVAVRRQQLNNSRGVLSEVVDVVIDEAKDVADSASHPKRTAR
jgi:hypothetical protein